MPGCSLLEHSPQAGPDWACRHGSCGKGSWETDLESPSQYVPGNVGGVACYVHSEDEPGAGSFSTVGMGQKERETSKGMAGEFLE